MINGVMSMVLMSTMIFNSSPIDVKEIKPIDENIVYTINKKEVPHITIENFEEEVIKSDKLVLVDFYATWCSPCKKLSPVILKLYETEIDLKVVKVDGPSQNDLRKYYNVEAYPTMIFFKDGKEVKRVLGYKKYEVLKEEIENQLKNINSI